MIRSLAAVQRPYIQNFTKLIDSDIHDNNYDDGDEHEKKKLKTFSTVPKLQQLKLKIFSSTADNPITRLETSWDINKTIQKIKNHRWEKIDLQYVIITAGLLYAYWIIISPGVIIKTVLALALLAAILVPITSQFFFPALPIFTWLFVFYSCSSVPVSIRPPIQVQFLPAIESIMYGDDLSNILSSFQHPVLDILAWLPYGIIHFAIPFITAALIFLFAPPTTLRTYGFSFGFMNLTGVLIQLCFPCAPPWYKYLYGLKPATYSVSGSAGGLARVDDILGVQMYGTSFGASPMVFGALPSLHSGCAVMIALYLNYVFPKWYIVWTGYVLWIWWSTMYLTHHYFVDLVGGAMLSFVCFHITKRYMLPKIHYYKLCRWDYDKVDYEYDMDSINREFLANEIDMIDDTTSPLLLPLSSPTLSSASASASASGGMPNSSSPILSNHATLMEIDEKNAFVSGHRIPFNFRTSQDIYYCSHNNQNQPSYLNTHRSVISCSKPKNLRHGSSSASCSFGTSTSSVGSNSDRNSNNDSNSNSSNSNSSKSNTNASNNNNNGGSREALGISWDTTNNSNDIGNMEAISSSTSISSVKTFTTSSEEVTLTEKIIDKSQ